MLNGHSAPCESRRSNCTASVQGWASSPSAKCPGDADIHLRYNWRTPPTADKYVDVVTKGPEDAATTMGRTRDEPSGKKAYMGGLLTWRKVTTEAAGCTRAPS